MSEELFARIGKGLFPVDERGQEALHGLPEGKPVMLTIRKHRNAKQFRLYWAVVSILMENAPEFDGWDREQVSQQLKLDAGAVDWFTHKATGATFGVPQSLKFESMSADRFSRFLDRVIYIVSTQYVPGLAQNTIRRRIEEMCQ